MPKETICPMCGCRTCHVISEDRHGKRLECEMCRYQWITIKDFKKLFNLK